MTHFLITLLFAAMSSALFFEKVIEDPNRSTGPDVELTLSNIENGVSWGSQIRYLIEVNDDVDGASKYNEINPQEVFLEISFMPNSESPQFQGEMNNRLTREGLALLGRSSCFGCNADKASMIGPSFSDIANSYTNEETDINKLVSSIRQGSTGVWGDAEMPANQDMSEEDATTIVEYVLMQGAKEYSWVYPGLEGVFRVIDKPQKFEQGRYVLTASYTSSIDEYGEDSKVFVIE